MKEFIVLEKYGQLYIDKVLFETYFPIIFTCVNEKRDVFIVVCCQNNEKGCKWLLGRTSAASVVKMLQDKMTVRQLLLNCSSEKVTVDRVEDGYKIAYHGAEWEENSPYLPKEDSYMYAEEGEFAEEIQYFSSFDDPVQYNAGSYKCVAKARGSVDRGPEPIADFTSALGIVPITGKIVVNALKISGRCPANALTVIDEYAELKSINCMRNDTFKVSSNDLNIKVGSDDTNSTNAA